MTTTDPITQLAAQLGEFRGEVRAQMKQALDGIEEIKTSQREHGARISAVEAENAVLRSEVGGLRDWSQKHETDHKASRSPALVVAIVAVIFTGLGWLRTYLGF